MNTSTTHLDKSNGLGQFSPSPTAPRSDLPITLLAHRSDLLLIGLADSLSSSAEIGGQYTNLNTLLTGLSSHKTGIDLLILDDRLDGTPLELIQRVLAAAPKVRLIVLSRMFDGLYIADVLHAGARGFLYTREPLSDIVRDAVQAVMAGRCYMSPAAASHYMIFAVERRQSRRAQRDDLEPEERQALALLLDGCDVPETMRRMNINRQKVYRVHQRLRNWFGVTTNEALVRQVLLSGFQV